MGPLVPFVLSNEFGLFAALLVGIGFGFVLEQAGFSSTKKLVGLFYGYDFTVLRVFFTAGVTAMIGVLFLEHFGLIDVSAIYVNPTFMKSAIVGGLIMGAGFIIGGFCPGTSICAVAIGKIDAMAFVVGALIGIFIFMEIFPTIEDIYLANDMGAVKINEVLGISPWLFAFIMTAVALTAFYFTWRIENKINRREHVLSSSLKRTYTLAISVPIAVLLFLLVFPSQNEMIENRIVRAKEQKKCDVKVMSADKLAHEIVNNNYSLNVIDVRSKSEFEQGHLPLAINIPFEELGERQWERIFQQKIKKNVFYADNDTLVRMSCLKARFIGKSDNYILGVGARDFREMFFEMEEPSPSATKDEQQLYTFRSQSAKHMLELVKSLENINKPVKREVVVATGGC